MKITNLFKEKKKSNKRFNLKNGDDMDSDDENFKELETKFFKNKKIKFQYPKPKPKKTLKILLDLKDKTDSNEIDSKSTQAFSKKYENLSEEASNLNIKPGNNESKQPEMKGEEEENLAQNSENLLELSSQTKNILNKVMNKKKEEKQNKISNKENDSSLFENIKKPLSNKTKILFTTDSINANIKKSEPPKISTKTIEILEKLKEDRKNRFNRPENSDKNFRSESSFSSIKFKYEELLSKPRELRLPIKYKQLYNAFLSLEQTICLNKIREKNQMNTFDNIRNNVENVTHHTFNMKTLQQILYIVPHFYILKYVKKKDNGTFNINDCLNKDFDLIIDIPKDFNERITKNFPSNFNFLSINYYDINNKEFSPTYLPLKVNESLKRKEIFRNILNRIVNFYHERYLEKNNIKIKFNPLKEKTWEHNFNPDEECNDIPLFEIPLPPNKTSVFQETIMKNDIKNEIMKDALNMINKSNKEETNASQNLNLNQKNKSLSSSKNKYVSQKFLEKIRAKEKANNIINEINNYSHFHNSNKDMNSIYKEILLQMKTILIVNKKSMELNKISESVLNSSQLIKDNFVEKEKISEIICKLCEKFSNNISVKNHSIYGKIVVLENSNFQIPKNIVIDN